ncbi:CvpA family protein [Blastopirellula sp. J2-11]|uniref:CvpA family protein n=1 Tax=Blastopirellula sp. J2-11 TaxID=2943192 RepID=UPI0021C79128|nr:CvpA family protein [Blastopirellula sp. J2-11]UUO08271.1 CvpA family protein [Blastopirellula sp. J2-11]
MANGYDVLMVIVLLAATAWGLYKGMAWQLASFASIFASYVLSVQLREPVAALFPLDPPWNKLAAMLALYVGCSLVVWVGFRFISKTIESMKLKDFDRQVGALLGAAKGVLLCVIITMFSVAFATGNRREEIVQSRSGYYISHFIDKAQAIMPQEVHTAVKPYIDNFQQQIGDQPPITTANIFSGDQAQPAATNQQTRAPYQVIPQQWQQDAQQGYSQLKADYGQIQGAVDQALQNPQQTAQPYVNQFQQNLRDQVQREIDQRWGAATQGYQQPNYAPQQGYQQQGYAPQPTYPQQPGYYPQGYAPQQNGQLPRY